MFTDRIRKRNMPVHRFRDLTRENRTPAAATAVSCGGFMACPAALQTGAAAGQLAWQQRLYQWAFEQARAVVRPSVLERLQRDLVN
jgi:hypothetical protein